MAYSIHQIIQKYNLPLTRGRDSTLSFLRKYYNAFQNDLNDSFSAEQTDFPQTFYQELKKIFPMIKKQCRMLLEIIELDEKHQHLDQRQEFNQLMRLLRDYDALREYSSYTKSVMIRIRPGNGPFDKRSLFHIPYDLRHLASSQRFSIPGDPCLYLSLYPGSRKLENNMLELSWMESGMPKVFYVSLFQAKEALKLLHLAKKGSKYLQEYDEAKTDDRRTNRQTAIKQYLLTFPLRCACSISVEGKYKGERAKNAIHYYEEYMIPQLLVEWIQQSDYFDGLTYQSAAPVREAEKNYAYNVVLPTKCIDPADGYDMKLKRAFRLSEPKKVDLWEQMKEFDDEINEVFEYRRRLDETIRMYAAGDNHPYRRLLGICDTFYSICAALKDTTDTSAALPFQRLDELCQVSFLVHKTIVNCKDADEWVNSYKDDFKDKILTEDDYCDILCRYNNIHSIMQKVRDGVLPRLCGPDAFSHKLQVNLSEVFHKINGR